jgi:hypothetical protein
MTQLTVVGPYLEIHSGQYERGGTFAFRRGDINPLVGELYRVVDDFASQSGVDVSFPTTSPYSDPRELWIDAVDRLASADAVLAIFDGESQAIALEAALARQMDLPLLVAAVDETSAGMLERANFPVIDARYGLPAVVEGVQKLLYGRGESTRVTPQRMR